YNVLSVPFDVEATPPGGETFELAWVQGDSTLYAQQFTLTGAQLTQGAKVTVTTGGGAVTDPHVAAFIDGTFLVGWSEGTDAWLQRFDGDAQPIGAKVR